MPWNDYRYFDVDLTNSLSDDTFCKLIQIARICGQLIIVTQNLKFVFHMVENIVGKEENVGFQHFLLVLQCFLKSFSQGCQKPTLFNKGLLHLRSDVIVNCLLHILQ